MPAATKDVMLRTWELLRLIPQREFAKTARCLMEELKDRGYPVSKKTVERDLVELSTIFPITSDEASKPYQWFWAPDASLDLPGVALTEALTLVFVDETLRGLIHKSLLAPIQGRLAAAKRLLAGANGNNPKAAWTDKIGSVPRNFTLRPPRVQAGLIEQVQEALLSDRQLEIEYRSLQDTTARWRTLNPRALLLKGSVMYLLADAMPPGANRAEHPVKQYALHRVTGARPSKEPLVERLFSLNRYIRKQEDAVGSRNGIRLRLRVSSNMAKILRETPLGTKQRMRPSGTHFVVEAAVRNTPALRQWILGHCGGVEVLAPADLREAIRGQVMAAAAVY